MSVVFVSLKYLLNSYYMVLLHEWIIKQWENLLLALLTCVYSSGGLPWWLSVEESVCQCRRKGLILGSGRSPREGNGNPLQYSCLGNPMDRQPGGL